MKEGCLSLPGVEVEIERPYEIIVFGINEKNVRVEIKAKSLLSALNRKV